VQSSMTAAMACWELDLGEEGRIHACMEKETCSKLSISAIVSGSSLSRGCVRARHVGVFMPVTHIVCKSDQW
jgi:hypothetical protein